MKKWALYLGTDRVISLITVQVKVPSKKIVRVEVGQLKDRRVNLSRAINY